MKAKQSVLKLIILINMFIFSQIASAQIVFNEIIDDETPPIPEAPINGLIGLGLLIGAYFGYKKLKE